MMKKEITTSNIISMTRLCMGPAIMILLIYSYNIYALILFIIALLTDALDGYIARKRKEVTEFGRILDPVSDKIVYSFTISGILLANNILSKSSLAVLIAVILVIYAAGYNTFIKKKFHIHKIGKAATALEGLLLASMILGYVNFWTIAIFVIMLIIPAAYYLIEMITK